MVLATKWDSLGPNVPDHFSLCQTRLKSLQRRLRVTPDLMREYNKIIQEQMRLGIVEAVSDCKGPDDEIPPNCHYLPHHGVVHLSSQTTKLRIVYDGSARAQGDDCSLNDCLQKGPNYIPKLFEVLV